MKIKDLIKELMDCNDLNKQVRIQVGDSSVELESVGDSYAFSSSRVVHLIPRRELEVKENESEG